MGNESKDRFKGKGTGGKTKTIVRCTLNNGMLVTRAFAFTQGNKKVKTLGDGSLGGDSGGVVVVDSHGEWIIVEVEELIRA